MKLSVDVVNGIQIRARVRDAGPLFAFHLLDGDQPVEMTSYTSASTHIFSPGYPGSFRVKALVKDGPGPRLERLSDQVTIAFDDPLTGPIAQPEFALVGLNRTTLAAVLIMGEIAPVVAIVSPVHAGKSVFGVPVVAHAPDGVVRLVDLGRDKMASYATSLDPMARDLRSVIADGLAKMDLLSVHRMSASLLSTGLKGASQELDDYIFERFNSRVPASVKIGEGTVLGYGGIGTVINKSAVIGRNCVIGQNVTIGARSSDAPPVIGDNVYVGPHAVCIGGSIGTNVVVGAGSVVTKPVESNCVVAGSPARVISTDMWEYRGYTRAYR